MAASVSPRTRRAPVIGAPLGHLISASTAIDVHVHFFGPGSGKLDHEALDRSRVEDAKRLGITHMMTSVLGSWGCASPTYMASREDVTMGNRFLHGMMRRYPGFVLGYCHVNPTHGAFALKELEWGLDHGMVGLKLAGACLPTDPRAAAVIRRAAKARVPILHHVVHHMDTRTSGGVFADSTDLAEAGRRFPEATFLLAHIGGGGDWEWGIRAVRRVPNVILDTSGSGTDAGMVEMAVADLGADRVVFGTDLTIPEGVAKIEGANLPQAVKDKIYFKNMQRILGSHFPRSSHRGRGKSVEP